MDDLFRMCNNLRFGLICVCAHMHVCVYVAEMSMIVTRTLSLINLSEMQWQFIFVI